MVTSQCSKILNFAVICKVDVRFDHSLNYELVSKLYELLFIKDAHTLYSRVIIYGRGNKADSKRNGNPININYL